MLLTIGYQRLRPERLLQLATAFDATVLDCRYKPLSRRAGFGGRQLAALLGERYRWAGESLGGYGRTTPNGIASLKEFLETPRNAMLLCMEESPAECHRHDAICDPHFPNALHICRDDVLKASALSASIKAGNECEVFTTVEKMLAKR
jgi:hypothetical protein